VADDGDERERTDREDREGMSAVAAGRVSRPATKRGLQRRRLRRPSLQEAALAPPTNTDGAPVRSTKSG
jgi:hypothetical protein